MLQIPYQKKKKKRKEKAKNELRTSISTTNRGWEWADWQDWRWCVWERQDRRPSRQGGFCESLKREGGAMRERREGRGVLSERVLRGESVRERQEGLCVVRESFGKLFIKNLSINPFPYFYIGFFDQLKLFSVWLVFYNKTNTCKYWKYFPKNNLQRNKWSQSIKYIRTQK